ncbi:hypothetical protein ACOI22_09595 [Glaciecola sp. 2405UD65-10]|uniref:hypothetical protein n=1 Tax=Glaciecola sp. 2405UD65-10 TaxID=3397244 RepID=UPI003B5957B7
MALDLGKLLKQKAYACIETSIGELCVFGINVKGQTELRKNLDSTLEDCISADFIRNLCVYICFPKASLKDKKYKPDKPILTNEDVSKLTEDELEKIAGIYIHNNEYLFKKLEFTKKKNEKGEIVNHGEYNEIEHPRNEQETNISYLYRLSILEKEKHKKQMEDMLKSVSGIGGFSSNLTDSIKNTFTMGDSLSKAMESIRPISMPELRPIEREPSNIDYAKIERGKEERRLQPFNELSNRLDQLIESSIQTSEFMIEANKIQTRIASEIKESGDQTDKHSRKNILLSGIVIVLTVIGLSLTAFVFISGNKFNEYQQENLESSAKEIVSSLSDINANLANEGSKSQNTLDLISRKLIEIDSQKKLYEQLLAQHKSLIESLESANSEQKVQIIELQGRIKSLEEAKSQRE